MEQIHTAGFVFNDLKLDNLMLDHDAPLDDDTLSCNEANETIFDKCNVNIIDFGFATSFVDSTTGEHIKKEEVDAYRGNFYFSSTNHLKYRTTSRRDDMISLFYLLEFANISYLPPS